MKRSEMIELIARRLCPVGISEPTCEEVLDIIEEAGMLPPSYLKDTNVPFWNGEAVGPESWPVNEWEPEDEKK